MVLLLEHRAKSRRHPLKFLGVYVQGQRTPPRTYSQSQKQGEFVKKETETSGNEIASWEKV